VSRLATVGPHLGLSLFDDVDGTAVVVDRDDLAPSSTSTSLIAPASSLSSAAGKSPKTENAAIRLHPHPRIVPQEQPSVVLGSANRDRLPETQAVHQATFPNAGPCTLPTYDVVFEVDGHPFSGTLREGLLLSDLRRWQHTLADVRPPADIVLGALVAGRRPAVLQLFLSSTPDRFPRSSALRVPRRFLALMRFAGCGSQFVLGHRPVVTDSLLWHLEFIVDRSATFPARWPR